MSDGDIWPIQQPDGSVRYAYDEEGEFTANSRSRKDTSLSDLNKMLSAPMLEDAVTSHVLHSMVILINFVVVACTFIFALQMNIICLHLRFCTG